MSLAQVFSSDFWKIPQNSLLQSNLEQLRLEVESCYGKKILEIINWS